VGGRQARQGRGRGRLSVLPCWDIMIEPMGAHEHKVTDNLKRLSSKKNKRKKKSKKERKTTIKLCKVDGPRFTTTRKQFPHKCKLFTACSVMYTICEVSCAQISNMMLFVNTSDYILQIMYIMTFSVAYLYV
jgi:hypothetical protein